MTTGAGARPRVIIVLPAYNAAATLELTLRDLPRESVDDIILVDDGSRDDTVAIAHRLGLTVYQRERNGGYGANQKTCYRLARERGADYVVMIHPDYQYDPRMIPAAVAVLEHGICDVVLGNRIRSRSECLHSGMPLYKYLANRMLTLIENIALGQNLGEFHSGFRAYRRVVLETIPYERNADGFLFDSQFLFQAYHFGFILGDIPVPVRYFPEASSIKLWNSIAYGTGTLWHLFLLLLHRLRLRASPLYTNEIHARGGR
jgi:glycosyltransferase involved in cell wall biosynthesis